MILENMNTSVDPCDNFFEFTCGGFIEKTRLSSGQYGVNTFSTLSEKLALALAGIYIH
jgi:neprilysin